MLGSLFNFGVAVEIEQLSRCAVCIAGKSRSDSRVFDKLSSADDLTDWEEKTYIDVYLQMQC